MREGAALEALRRFKALQVAERTPVALPAPVVSFAVGEAGSTTAATEADHAAIETQTLSLPKEVAYADTASA